MGDLQSLTEGEPLK